MDLLREHNIIYLCYQLISLDLSIFPVKEVITCTNDQKQNCYHWTLRNLKKVRVPKAIAMENQEGTYHPVLAEPTIERPHRQSTMENFWRLVTRNDYLAVKQAHI